MCSQFDQLHSHESPEINLEGNTWELPNDLGVWKQVYTEFEKRLSDLGWSEVSILELSVAVEEAIINAITHGNLGVSKENLSAADYQALIIKTAQLSEHLDKKVIVTLDLTTEKAVIRVRDTGSGFSLDVNIDATSTQTHGRGITLMKNSCDAVHCISDIDGQGNTIELVKYNPQAQV